jgi:type II secretory pathway pseudopilin PulG
LQTASLLLGIILVAIGVVLVTSLNTVRIIQDAHTVYSNALAAMQSLTTEIRRANRYGWHPGLTYAIPNTHDNSVYGTLGPEDPNAAPSLSGVDEGTELYLRVNVNDPSVFTDDIALHFSRDGANNLMLNVNGTDRVVATHVRALNFWKVTYNAVAVRLEVEGELFDEIGVPGTRKHVIQVNNIISLREAGGRSLESAFAASGTVAGNARW